MEVKLSKWNVILVFHVFIIKPSEGLASTNGELIFSPASLVSVGTNLTIICINKQKTCTGSITFLFEINQHIKNPYWQNQTTSMIQIVDIRVGYHVVCYIECHGNIYVINMMQLQVGYPPDRPTKIKCHLEEFSTKMKCEWDTGQITGLATHYKLHLKNLQTGEDTIVSTTSAVVSFPVNITQNVTLQIQIFAVNPLDQSESEFVRFRLADIVVPLTPVIRNINISDSNLIIYINWRNQTSENQRYCEVEYKTLEKSIWTSVAEEINKHNIISIKKIRNADSLRLRCREEFGKSYWSKWSAPRQMPPSAPEEIPNVWRVLGRQLHDGAQEVTILIASDLNNSPQMNVSGYEVYYYNQGVRMNLQQCPPSGVQCVAHIPKRVQNLFISSYNPYGFSPAIDLPIQEEDGSGPQNVTVKSLHLTSMSVQWQHPLSSTETIRWYVLQWTSDSCDGKHKNVSWQKTGKEQTNFTIKDNAAPGQRLTISLYAVYSTRVSRPSIVYGYTQELAPNTGPSSIKIVNASLDARVIEWAEVPLCGRRGFITGYTVRIKQYSNGSQFEHQISGSKRHFLFNQFNPDERYSVCISASTRAGDGPADHCITFHQDKDFSSYVGLLAGMAFGVFVLAAIILTLSRIWKRVKKRFLLLLPKCLHEEYPRVERSSAVKSLQEANKESPESLVPLSSDPEIVEIEEMPKEVTSYPVTITSTKPAQETKNITEVDESPLIPTADIDVPENSLGYRPQTANVTSQQPDFYCSPAQMLNLQMTILTSGSPVIPTNNTFLLNTTDDIFEEMNLMVTADIDVEDEPSSRQSTANPTLESLWENQTFMDMLVMQDVPGDQVTSTQPSLLQEFDDTKSYFPQLFSGRL
ncbi:interleukin-23 receptor [Rhinoderma darwinii]|uniref:interleukin-23 receptor n=1 Tax=Rhinoderma darwinii TaxID=43563 RepID=UPI003F67DBF4